MKKLLVVLFLLPHICFANTFWISDLHTGSVKKRKTVNDTIYPRKSYNWFKKFLKKTKQGDYVIITGDITHQGQLKYFKKLQKLQKKYNIIFVRGNHDGKLVKYIPANQVIDTPEYRIITLDSGLSTGLGTLDDKQIDFVRDNLASNTIVAMHHPCFSKKQVFLDYCKPFLDMPIKKVISGHYHFSMSNNLNGIDFLTIPAFSAKQYYKIL